MNNAEMEQAWAEAGRRVLQLEAAALTKASERLPDRFVEAARAIYNCKSKLVVTGLGKSGHIARKLSATFASTGTPAFYLHPVEALHGDFGMISSTDVLLAIAFRGETEEVNTVARFAHRLGCQVLAMTGFPQSTLAQISHVTVEIAKVEEACSINLVPTTSSTLTLALGDALAVAVMESRGFGVNEFARLHPGGSLGRRLASVREFTRPSVEAHLLNAESAFAEIITAITSSNFGIALVVNSIGELVGVITDGDLRRKLASMGGRITEVKARDLMSTTPKVIDADQPVLDAVAEMEKYRVTSLIVVSKLDNRRPIGLIRMHDLLEAKVI